MQEDIYFSSFIQANEKDFEKDLQHIKSIYPQEIRQYNDIIEQECDKLEYEGSPMYAEILDKETIHRMAERIVEQAVGDTIEMTEDREAGRWFPFISTMLCNEMFIRRCRRCNRCRMFGKL